MRDTSSLEVGHLRNHPEDGDGQRFDAERYGSPIFVVTIRADIRDGLRPQDARIRQVSFVQGSAAGMPGARVILPMGTMTVPLDAFLRKVAWEIVKYEGQFCPTVSTEEHRSGELIRRFRTEMNAAAVQDPTSLYLDARRHK